MRTLCLASEEEYSGVSAICIGLSLRLQRDGYRVGYMKPLGYMPLRVGSVITDVDARFMWELLKIDAPLECSTPVVLTAEVAERALRGDRVDYHQVVLDAFSTTSKDKDVFLVEGALNIHQGRFLKLSAFDVTELLSAGIVLVERFEETDTVDKVLSAAALLGDRLHGVILNIISPERKPFVDGSLVPYLEAQGIPVLGSVPLVRILKSVSVAQLADFLHGQVLCAHDHRGDRVEGVMIGAMGPEHALSYFRRAPHQAVLTGGDRGDIQLAALEAHVRCIVLTGNHPPSPVILGKAEDMGIPMILVEYDTMTAAEQAEWVIGHARTHEPEKLEALVGIMDQHVNLPRLYEIMGLGE